MVPRQAGPAGETLSMPPQPGQLPPQPGPQYPGAPMPSAGGGRGWPGVLALVLAVVLTIGLGVQTWQLVRVSSSLNQANDQLDELAQGQADGGDRLDSLEDRAAELERIAGEAFDPAAIAEAVLPSVFLVRAGNAGGTAFAVSEAENGGTNLFTNYHVVEGVWDSGGRDVSLERTNQRYPARIVDVNPQADVAWLQADTAFDGLTVTSDEVRAGQQVVAVGSPRGLTDTVTAGVVSSPAQRLPDGSGPWIQFDAAINPGNSGGPVINAAQEVVGIATAKDVESEGLGFAVPISVACDHFDICST